MSTLGILKALADETRLRILSLILEAEDLCACEIEAILELSQSNASRHLSRLREAGLVADERRGQWRHFSVPGPVRAADALAHLVVDAARSDLAVLHHDSIRLANYRSSGNTCETIRAWNPS